MFVAIANTSAAIVAYQMPFKSNNNGIINTQDVWYSNVLHVAETTEIKPGVWHVMPITQGDHGSAIGLFEKKDVTNKFYEDLIKILTETEKICSGLQVFKDDIRITSPEDEEVSKMSVKEVARLIEWLEENGHAPEKINECIKYISE